MPPSAAPNSLASLAPPAVTLAAADFAGLFQSVGGPLLALIVVVVIGWFGIVRIRRWMKGEEEANEPFTLNDLRQLRQQGKLSEEEFAKARDAMIGAVRSSAKARSAEPRAGADGRATGSAPQHPAIDQPMTGSQSSELPPPKSPKRPPQLG